MKNKNGEKIEKFISENLFIKISSLKVRTTKTIPKE